MIRRFVLSEVALLFSCCNMHTMLSMLIRAESYICVTQARELILDTTNDADYAIKGASHVLSQIWLRIGIFLPLKQQKSAMSGIFVIPCDSFLFANIGQTVFVVFEEQCYNSNKDAVFFVFQTVQQPGPAKMACSRYTNDIIY